MQNWPFQDLSLELALAQSDTEVGWALAQARSVSDARTWGPAGIPTIQSYRTQNLKPKKSAEYNGQAATLGAPGVGTLMTCGGSWATQKTNCSSSGFKLDIVSSHFQTHALAFCHMPKSVPTDSCCLRIENSLKFFPKNRGWARSAHE